MSQVHSYNDQLNSQISPNNEEENDSVNTASVNGRISILDYSKKDDPTLMLKELRAKNVDRPINACININVLE